MSLDIRPICPEDRDLVLRVLTIDALIPGEGAATAIPAAADGIPITHELELALTP
ncbi:hypothetical protein ACFXJ8_17480 [Nonomuraea sp. NPDC059194]|uniref:hypothetical protein n=1 Tax=Nonomuraea sp. NPDC059194 TaxID=3346764 RepID=UPI0036CC250D